MSAPIRERYKRRIKKSTARITTLDDQGLLRVWFSRRRADGTVMVGPADGLPASPDELAFILRIDRAA